VGLAHYASMQKNWITFYDQKRAPLEPSTFAKFILAQGIDAQSCIDLGCGNGRDSYALAQRYKTRGVDPATLPERTDWAIFARAPWQAMAEEIKQTDIVYSRFFLHAIPQNEVEEILKLAPKYFIAEARAVGDVPRVYPEHERHYVSDTWLLHTLMELGFEVIFYQKGRGLAPYKNEDPLLVRVIAKRHL